MFVNLDELSGLETRLNLVESGNIYVQQQVPTGEWLDLVCLQKGSVLEQMTRRLLDETYLASPVYVFDL